MTQGTRMMAAMSKPDNKQVALEVAHVLFLDIVGYSRLSTSEQHGAIATLNEIVRDSEQIQTAETNNRLIKIPTGDGMALVFYTSPEAPAYAAVELNKALKEHPQLQLRMGIHSGSVSGVIDVNGRPNLAGAGLNIAQRVMDCGDAGHILVSKHAADDLDEYEHWRTRLHDLGPCEVKHGVKVHLSNLWDEEIGNRQLPAKLRIQRKRVRRRRWIWPVAAALIVAAIISIVLVAQRANRLPVSEKSIAVLPFKPLLPEHRDPVLEMGMADSLIARLSSTHELVVPSLTSVRQYSSPDQDPIAAGRKLGVGSILEGTVQEAGGRVRVTVRLIKVADGSSLWAQTFDEQLTDVFGIQDKISQQVAEALTLHLNGEQQKRLVKRDTENFAAYQLYLTGRYHWNKLIPPEIAQSIGFYKRAIELDPNYALAYYGLAEAYRALAITSDMPAREVFPQGKAGAEKALELDDSLAEPHATLAMIHMWFDWDWESALNEGKRGISLNPKSAYCHWAYAHVLSNLGRHQEAIAESTRGQELDPTSLITNARDGAVLLFAGQYEKAIERCRKTIELDPHFWIAHLFLGHTLLKKGNYAEALSEFKKARELSRDNSETISMIGYVAARAGDRAQAQAILDELTSLSSKRYIPPSNIATVHVALGGRDEALALLEKAYDERDVRLSFIKIDPKWDPVRSDPRFISLLKRIGLQ